jgi:hypothetical protein
MRLATPDKLPTDNPPNISAAAEAFALTERRLAELDRLRSIGMEQAETLSSVTRKLACAPEAQYRAMVGGKGTIREFDRLNRAIRQIVVLEFELRGLFKAPDRGGVAKPKLGESRYDLLRDLNDYSDLYNDRRDIDDINDLNDLRVRLDYRKDPVDRLVADIRSILGVDAPKDDPFASAAEAAPRAPEPRECKPMSREAAVRERAVENFRRALAARRAMLAKSAAAAEPSPAKVATASVKLPRKGFRTPPTSPHNPNTPSAKRKRRRNRGPPR